ncbi:MULTISPECIES: hypothetical protein [unclassified Streptomyces]
MGDTTWSTACASPPRRKPVPHVLQLVGIDALITRRPALEQALEP